MKGFGRRARLSLGAQVVAAVLLAVGGAVLAIDLADRRYVRLDLSASGRNTLDESVLDLIDGLPERVTADVFFRPLVDPYRRISVEVQGSMLELLFVAAQSRRNRFDLRVHDLSDFEAVQQRQRELGVEGVNIVVYTNESGGRKAVQDVFRDLAVIDWGSPTPEGARYLIEQGIGGVVDTYRGYDPRGARPATLSAFRGEEALAEALLKVSSARSPRVYFSSGQGEPDLHGTLSEDVGALRGALEDDGFEVLEWNPAEEPGVPDDCEVLALIGPAQPFPPDTLEEVRAYVAAGGRVIAAPRLAEVERGTQGGVVELLRGFGMLAEPGIVCESLVARSGQRVDGTPQCAVLLIGQGGLSTSHPLTEPLLRRGRRVQFSLSPALRRGGLESGGILLDLISSGPDSWLDLPTVAGQPDFAFDHTRERRDRHALAMAAELPTFTDADGEPRRGRVLGIASASFLCDGLFDVNRDFLVNAFNWMAERDYRVRVTPLPRGESRLDLQRGRALPIVSYALYAGLPAVCMAVGLFLAWRRRSR